MENKPNSKERVFSVELKSKRNLKNVTLTNGSSDAVLLEGTIGELVHATFKEGVILEVMGKNGVLRVDLGENEICKLPVQNRLEMKNNEQDKNCGSNYWGFSWVYGGVSWTWRNFQGNVAPKGVVIMAWPQLVSSPLAGEPAMTVDSQFYGCWHPHHNYGVS